MSGAQINAGPGAIPRQFTRSRRRALVLARPDRIPRFGRRKRQTTVWNFAENPRSRSGLSLSGGSEEMRHPRGPLLFYDIEITGEMVGDHGLEPWTR